MYGIVGSQSDRTRKDLFSILFVFIRSPQLALSSLLGIFVSRLFNQ